MGEGHEPACHLRLPRVCLHLAHPSMYGTTCPYLPFGCQPSRQCVVSMRRTSRPFLMYTAPPARRGRRIHTVRELWQGNRPARTKMPLCWQDVANMRSPGVRRWRDCALMRSWPDWQWQYSRAMRSRGSCRGKIPPRCVLGRQSMASFALHASRKRSRTGKSPVRGKIRTPRIRNELALARCARHVSEKPRKSPSEDTPREDLARKGPFSLHGPLESCTARRSCHPASANHPSARNLCAAEQCEPPAITAPPSWRGSPRNMPPGTAPNRPSARNPCAAHAPPQRQSATRGPTAP